MKGTIIRKISTAAILVGAFVAIGMFSPLVAQESSYPAPRYPTIPRVQKPEELLDIARMIVRAPARRQCCLTGYGIQGGERVLIVVDRNFERLVLDAIVMAMNEAGARVDVFLEEPGKPRGHRSGHQELEGWSHRGEAKPPFAKVIAEVGRYDLLLHGAGGPVPLSQHGWEFIPWNTVEKFVTHGSFPWEVQDYVDEAIWEKVTRARRIRVRDPEGTNIEWSSNPDDWKRVMKETGFDIVVRGHISLTPLFVPNIDARGVIAGTTNHTGAFPRVKLHVDNGKIMRVEGGGTYGERWQELLNKHKNDHYAGHPGPGIGWLIEAAVGTNVLASRLSNALDERLSWERTRAGVIHWGLGITGPHPGAPGFPSAQKLGEFQAFLTKTKLPSGHFHVHTLFSTAEVQLEDGQWVTLIDKGRITFLDTPEARRIAAKYGDPDKILKELWVPAMPGINVPGDYNQYGQNPEAWIAKELQENFKR